MRLLGASRPTNGVGAEAVLQHGLERRYAWRLPQPVEVQRSGSRAHRPNPSASSLQRLCSAPSARSTRPTSARS